MDCAKDDLDKDDKGKDGVNGIKVMIYEARVSRNLWYWERNVEDRTANFKLHFLLNYLVLDDLNGFYFFGIENLTQSYITDT